MLQNGRTRSWIHAMIAPAIMMIPISCSATTLRVPSQYSTIQAAIDASHSGDTVQVADGLYAGNGNRDLTFGGRNILLTSENGPGSTVIDCAGTVNDPHRGVIAGAGETSLGIRGFTVKNGVPPGGYGGGMLLYNIGVTVDHCIIQNCHDAFGGGGIYSRCSSPVAVVLNHCVITHCSGIYGGAIYFYDDDPGSSMTVVGCKITGNDASLGNGGGMANYTSAGPISVINSVIAFNAAASGGGLNNYAAGGAYVVTNCTIANNTAIDTGGVYDDINGGSVKLTNDIVHGNGGAQIRDASRSHSAVTYSAVDLGFPGLNNIDANPLFVDLSTQNLHLKPGSPALGNGNHAVAPVVDIEGVARPSLPSIGAYELATTDAAPSVDWARHFGEGPGVVSTPSKIVVDGSGNVIVAGTTSVTGGDQVDARIVKYSAAGVQLWSKRSNEQGMSGSGVKSVVVDAAGNIYVAGAFAASTPGATGQQVVTLKYAADGTPLWRRSFERSSDADGAPVLLSPDGLGGVYVSTTTDESGRGQDFDTLKYDASGAKLWERHYNDPTNGDDIANAQTVDASGNLYVTGGSAGVVSTDLAVVKYDASGNSIWSRRLAGDASGPLSGTLIACDGSDHIVVAGDTSTGFLTVEYDQSGAKLWRQDYSENASHQAGPSALAVDPAGDVIVTSVGVTGGAIVKYGHAAGALQWLRRDSVGFTSHVAPSLTVDAAGQIYLSSSVWPGRAGHVSDLLTIKYHSDGSVAWRAAYGSKHENNSIALAVDSSGRACVTGLSGASDSYGFVTLAYAP